MPTLTHGLSRVHATDDQLKGYGDVALANEGCIIKFTTVTYGTLEAARKAAKRFQIGFGGMRARTRRTEFHMLKRMFPERNYNQATFDLGPYDKVATESHETDEGVEIHLILSRNIFKPGVDCIVTTMDGKPIKF